MQRDEQEVNAIPQLNSTADTETVTVTVDSGAYHAVGPPQDSHVLPDKTYGIIESR